jgi:anaerobic ribonucleoside-triphosphate reductase
VEILAEFFNFYGNEIDKIKQKMIIDISNENGFVPRENLKQLFSLSDY